MLRTHSVVLATIDNDLRTRYLLQDYFDLPRSPALIDALEARHLGQADLVCALLHFFDRRTPHGHTIDGYITAMIGHPIKICPPCLSKYRDPSPIVTLRTTGARRITYVAPDNPRLPNTDAYRAWKNFRVGLSVDQLVMRGATTKRDIRRLLKRGWIRIEA